ncbi:thioredoxin family protein, partial [bacterium]|nr:thioredoxin family protein [bacterium]
MKYLAQSAVVTVSCLVWTSLTFAQDAVLYDFTASWCGPCQQMNPIVHKLAREGFPVQQVDIDKNPELAKKYSVTSIPAFVMVVNGKETSRFVGRTTEGHLRQMLSAARQS